MCFARHRPFDFDVHIFRGLNRDAATFRARNRTLAVDFRDDGVIPWGRRAQNGRSRVWKATCNVAASRGMRNDVTGGCSDRPQ
jgi:hypothetical protein